MAEKIFKVENYKFKHPASILIAGVSMSGKSVFSKKLIDNLSLMFYPVPTKVIISYTENQPLYSTIQHHNLKLVKGLEIDFENVTHEPTLLLVDDQMRDGSSNKEVHDLFIKGVHHRNISLMYITQNLFNQGRFARDMRLNLHYYIIFKSPTFLSQVSLLNHQLFPQAKGFLDDAYKKATEKPYTYLFLNLHPHCEDELRVSTSILPNEEQTFFVPK